MENTRLYDMVQHLRSPKMAAKAVALTGLALILISTQGCIFQNNPDRVHPFPYNPVDRREQFYRTGQDKDTEHPPIEIF